MNKQKLTPPSPQSSTRPLYRLSLLHPLRNRLSPRYDNPRNLLPTSHRLQDPSSRSNRFGLSAPRSPRSRRFRTHATRKSFLDPFPPNQHSPRYPSPRSRSHLLYSRISLRSHNVGLWSPMVILRAGEYFPIAISV